MLAGLNKIAEAMKETVKGSNKGTTKLVKSAKVPGLTKQMKLEVYLKVLEVWM